MLNISGPVHDQAAGPGVRNMVLNSAILQVSSDICAKKPVIGPMEPFAPFVARCPKVQEQRAHCRYRRAASRNGLDKLQYNNDGCIDLYIGPTKPEKVDLKNWLQTRRGKAFLLTLRRYGSETA